MLAAASRGHIRLVAALLAAGTDVNLMSPDGETALWAAADHGHLDIMDLLFSHGADINIAGGYAGWTAMHRVAAAGQSDSVDYLLRHGADKDCRDAVDRTPLILAVMCRHVRCAAILLSAGADPNVGTARFGSPLNLAASHGNSSMVEVLMKYGASNHTAPYALHNAIDVDSVLCVRILLRSGANPNVLDPEGRTPLALAVYRGTQEAVKCLLQQNCDTELESQFRVGSQDVSYTALELSVAARQRLSTALLLMAGASTTKILPYLDVGQLQSFRSRIGRRSRNRQDALEWIKWLTAYLRTPKRLSQICRTVIRKSLPEVRFHVCVKALPLPSALKDYLCLDHIDSATESWATEVLYS